MNQIKMKIMHDIITDCIRIASFERRPDKNFIGCPDGKGGWKEHEVEPGLPTDHLPILAISTHMAENLYYELGKFFEPQKPSATTAELDSTKYHLEDMRKLVLKNSS